MPIHPTVVASAIVCGLLAEYSAAQTDWRYASSQAPVPARTAHAMAFDAARGQTVVFGGLSPTVIIAQTALWDGQRWTMPTLAAEPPARVDHAMTYDVARGRVQLFGGRLASGAIVNDFWEWDGASWLQVGGSAPPPRVGGAMAYDWLRRRTVLFGGAPPQATSLLDDTWEWDGTNWRQQSPALSPAPRDEHAMAYDVLRNRIVLFGGFVTASHLVAAADTWEWDGSNWAQPAVAGPSARGGHALAHDIATGRTLLFGGTNATEDLWAWNGSTWTSLPHFGNATPAPRVNATMAHDFLRGRTVLFGGREAFGGMRPETWEWDGSSWTLFERPAARAESAAAFDVARQRGVLFSGISATGAGGSAMFEDTWEWESGAWSRRRPAISPPGRRAHALTYDSVRQRVVLFGGIGNAHLGDTWEWDGDRWTQRLVASSPSARLGAAMAFDAARRQVVLFGGRGAIPHILRDTWTWDGVSWLQRSPASSPYDHAGAALTYDSARQQVVLFGGQWNSATGATFNDTWEWDGINWLQHFPVNSPPARTQAAFAFDPTRNRAVLFGGMANANSQGHFDDTWEWDGTDWTRRTPATTPTATAQAAAFFDASTARMVCFGGSRPTSAVSEETWGYGPVQPATVRSFGDGCVRTAGMPGATNDRGSLPWIGGTLTIAIDRVPPSAPLLLIVGFSRTTVAGQPLPLALDALGLTGCTLRTSLDRWFPLAANGTRGEVALSVPSDPSLVGGAFYCQAGVGAPLANPAGLVVTNALECRIGAR